MRVIRTEMYFEPKDVGFTLLEKPNVSVAWIGGEVDPGVAKQDVTVGNLTLDSVGVASIERKVAEVVRQSLAGRYPVTAQAELMAPVVDFVLSASIVVEHSPPSHTTLNEIVAAAKGKSPQVLGALLGYVAGEPHGLLLLITVPLGMLIVSSASGISRALEEGLHEVVKRIFKSPPKR
jgi:hypothetical protein